MLLIISMLGGCSKIPDKPLPETGEATNESSEGTESSEAPDIHEERDTVNYDIDPEDAFIKLNAEGGQFDGIVRSEGEYDGSGYIVLDEGMKFVHIADLPSSQHYRIILAAHSYGDAAISLSTGEGETATYYIPAEESMEFSLYAVDSIYLKEGPAILTFEVKKGSVSLDYILIENSTAVPETCYKTAVSVVGKNTGVHTISTMKFFSDSYGKRILTAQNVTPGTNAEIDAIYAETGRYPAMRCGDVMYSSRFADEEYAEIAEKEVELALQWGRDGGIISMGWHWYSPLKYGSDLYSAATMFDPGAAVTDRDIATASIEEIEGMYTSEMISENCLLLIQDIDHMAETLLRFKQEQLTVIWQPLPDGDSDLYWWGGNAESYKWLWQLMFRRMNEYHGLNNLIWVWNGTDPEYYPGDKVCDIYGQSLFSSTSASYASRFAAIAHLSDTDTKAVAITSCDTLQDTDLLKRDNAMWLWIAPASGSYIIDESGALSEQHTSWQRLNDVYNARICITRDELPDMSTYGIQYLQGTEEAAEIIETTETQ